MRRFNSSNLYGMLVQSQDQEKLIKKLNGWIGDNKYKIDRIFRFKVGEEDSFDVLPSQQRGILITFNIHKNRKFDPIWTDVLKFQFFKLFRKKDYHTLYQINCIDKIIKSQNNGVYDKSYMIDWSIYQNMLLYHNPRSDNRITFRKIFFQGYKFINAEQEDKKNE